MPTGKQAPGQATTAGSNSSATGYAPAHEQSSSTAPAAQPSGPRGDDDPSTAGPGATNVKSSTPENAAGHLNPSAPEDANTTPGTTTPK